MYKMTKEEIKKAILVITEYRDLQNKLIDYVKANNTVLRMKQLLSKEKEFTPKEEKEKEE